MPVLDYPIPKQNWSQEVNVLNAASQAGAGKPAAGPIKDAGPWETAVQKIVGFQNLEDDWDGQGAKAPSRDLLESAIGLAYTYNHNGVPPPQCVVPGIDGSVVFEWQHPDGTFAEVEIDRPLHAEVMVIEPGQPAKHWTLPTE